MSGITLAALGVILLLAAHPKMAGRFRDHENWMRFIGATHTGIEQLRADPRAAMSVLATAIIYQVSVVLTVGFVILTLDADVPVGAVLAFVPVVAMAQVVPISLSGLGVREGMFVLLLHPLGVSNGQAIGIGLLWYLTMLLVSLLGAPAFAVGGRAALHAGSRRTIVSTTTRTGTERVLRRLPGAKVLRDGHTIYWWVEILAIVLFYLVYSAVRNADKIRTESAFNHAKQLMGWQSTLGINHEQTINEWALHFKPLIVTANYFYGSLHFVVTIGVGIYLFTKWPNDYPRWRNTLGIATAIALIGFRFCPLMPPRLLDTMPGADYGFVDTLAKYPTLWSFNSGAVKKISNQYAAMPSVHCAWALWCACALVPRLRHLWAKVLAALYPVMTVVGDRHHREPLLPRRGRRLRRSSASATSAPGCSPASGRGRPVVDPAPPGRRVHRSRPRRPHRDRPRPRRDRHHRHRGHARDLVGELGGTVFPGGNGYGFRWVQVRSAPPTRHDGRGARRVGAGGERLPRALRRPPRSAPAPPHVQDEGSRRHVGAHPAVGLPARRGRPARPGLEGGVPPAARGARHGGPAGRGQPGAPDRGGDGRRPRSRPGRSASRNGGRPRRRRPPTP